ncbi:hypothetical protein O1L44_21850 [Streptomyces noursei]|nr:hypothetical protein [Streptomyces noursei]
MTPTPMTTTPDVRRTIRATTATEAGAPPVTGADPAVRIPAQAGPPGTRTGCTTPPTPPHRHHPADGDTTGAPAPHDPAHTASSPSGPPYAP